MACRMCQDIYGGRGGERRESVALFKTARGDGSLLLRMTDTAAVQVRLPSSTTDCR